MEFRWCEKSNHTKHLISRRAAIKTLKITLIASKLPKTTKETKKSVFFSGASTMMVKKKESKAEKFFKTNYVLNAMDFWCREIKASMVRGTAR